MINISGKYYLVTFIFFILNLENLVFPIAPDKPSGFPTASAGLVFIGAEGNGLRIGKSFGVSFPAGNNSLSIRYLDAGAGYSLKMPQLSQYQIAYNKNLLNNKILIFDTLSDLGFGLIGFQDEKKTSYLEFLINYEGKFFVTDAIFIGTTVFVTTNLARTNVGFIYSIGLNFITN